MDFSDDVKQAIPRPVLVFGGVGGARPCPLLRGWREFRRSGAPVRFLCFEGNVWPDVEGEGIADRGACFFPVLDSDRKRKRGEDELKDGTSSGVEERSDESSDTVESGRVSKAARGAWGRTVRLEETDKFYQVVKKLFLSGIAPRMGGGVAITTIHKVVEVPRQAQITRTALADAPWRDGGNAKFVWYGAPSADVAAVVGHGFGRTNSRVLGHRAHGDGVHLSSPQYPYASSTLAAKDSHREATISESSPYLALKSLEVFVSTKDLTQSNWKFIPESLPSSSSQSLELRLILSNKFHFGGENQTVFPLSARAPAVLPLAAAVLPLALQRYYRWDSSGTTADTSGTTAGPLVVQKHYYRQEIHGLGLPMVNFLSAFHTLRVVKPLIKRRGSDTN
ncbi:hypothetical protein ZWY2020_006476 [Hordeum vulgare]|nr:hypothetical protein ZWY2020_006476 [Hordeum vulgare]